MKTTLDFENIDDMTHLLVCNFAGALFDNLDTNDDGSLDGVTRRSGLGRGSTSQTLSEELAYGSELGFVGVGPDGGITPGHVFRRELPEGSFLIGEFDATNGPKRPAHKTSRGMRAISTTTARAM